VEGGRAPIWSRKTPNQKPKNGRLIQREERKEPKKKDKLPCKKGTTIFCRGEKKTDHRRRPKKNGALD